MTHDRCDSWDQPDSKKCCPLPTAPNQITYTVELSDHCWFLSVSDASSCLVFSKCVRRWQFSTQSTHFFSNLPNLFTFFFFYGLRLIIYPSSELLSKLWIRLDIWQHPLEGRSHSGVASTYKGQHNTERCRNTFNPRVGLEPTTWVFEPTRPTH
jgi:hypothetical protein